MRDSGTIVACTSAATGTSSFPFISLRTRPPMACTLVTWPAGPRPVRGRLGKAQASRPDPRQRGIDVLLVLGDHVEGRVQRGEDRVQQALVGRQERRQRAGELIGRVEAGGDVVPARLDQVEDAL